MAPWTVLSGLEFGISYFGQISLKNHRLTIRLFSNFGPILKRTVLWFYCFSGPIVAWYGSMNSPEWIRSLFGTSYFEPILLKNRGLTIRLLSNFGLILKRTFLWLYCFSGPNVAQYGSMNSPGWIRSLFGTSVFGHNFPKNRGLTIRVFFNFWLILKKALLWLYSSSGPILA